MVKKIFSLYFMVFCLLTAGVIVAVAGQPNFGPAIYADGVSWGTKGTTVLQSYEEIRYHYEEGNLDILPGHPFGGANYFQCPLLPVKEW